MAVERVKIATKNRQMEGGRENDRQIDDGER